VAIWRAAFRAGTMKTLSLTFRRAAIAVAAVSCLGVAPRAAAQFPSAPGTGPGIAETVEAIDSARVTTRILYITAHPDDESAAVLTYLARGLHAHVALLSLTRGEGGQNALGPEQAPQLGLIRTQELLAATRGYGVKLFFTRAPDFGFSKTPEETEKVWGDQVLEDMVRVIRTFRPNIVINHWGGVHGGHGHHQASGLLTPKAVQLAADAKVFPNLQDEGLRPWSAGTAGVQILNLERGSETPQGYVLPLDDISPLYGKSWREIGLDAFTNHRTQGIATFLGSPFLRRPIALVPEAGGKLVPGGLNASLNTLVGDASGLGCGEKPSYCSLLRKADEQLALAHAAALTLRCKEASERVASAGSSISAILAAGKPDRFALGGDAFLGELDAIAKRIDRALKLAAGFQFTAESDRAYVLAGEAFKVKTTTRCRAEVPCSFEAPDLRFPDQSQLLGHTDASSGQSGFEVTLTAKESKRGRNDVDLPEATPLIVAEQMVTIAQYRFYAEEPVTHIEATSTRVDRVPLRIVPAYTLAVEPKQAIEVLAKKRKPFDVLLKVHSYVSQPGKVSVGLDVPLGWTSTRPATIEFSGSGDQYAKLTVTPPNAIPLGTYAITAYAQRGDEKFTTSLEPLPSMPTQLWEELAQCIVHAFDVNVPENLRVGYITAEGEPIPEALQRLGIPVETLNAQTLAFGDLSKYDAIVVGVRAYELRPELPGANQRLLDYVSNGGTLVVQYNRDSVWDKLQLAPYRAKIGNPTPRITDENSPVKFLKPDDSLLNHPNKITQDDFQGWAQERGLYFWSQFDTKYTPLLAMNDPGESDLNGGLVYARYGKGIYIYTGIAFFRQLPEGVPGAYRLFVNLLSASRGH
jgi:LmbE family N-acetylglucosaminyl deacetylase